MKLKWIKLKLILCMGGEIQYLKVDILGGNFCGEYLQNLEETQFVVRQKFESRNLINLNWIFLRCLDGGSIDRGDGRRDDRQEEEKCKWWSVNGRYWSRLGILGKIGGRWSLRCERSAIPNHFWALLDDVLNYKRRSNPSDDTCPEVPDLLTVETQNE